MLEEMLFLQSPFMMEPIQGTNEIRVILYAKS